LFPSKFVCLINPTTIFRNIFRSDSDSYGFYPYIGSLYIFKIFYSSHRLIIILLLFQHHTNGNNLVTHKINRHVMIHELEEKYFLRVSCKRRKSTPFVLLWKILKIDQAHDTAPAVTSRHTDSDRTPEKRQLR